MANFTYPVLKVEYNKDPRLSKISYRYIEIPEDNSPVSESMLNDFVKQGIVLEKFEYETKNGYDCKTDNLAYAFSRKNKHAVRAVFNNRTGRVKGLNTQPDTIRWRVYKDAEYERDYAPQTEEKLIDLNLF